jgi:RNA-directed DNA polymerase
MMDIKEISSEIGMSSGYVALLLKHHNKYYKTYFIKKKYGKKFRPISTPSYEIKAIQGWILRNYLDKIEISERATGFKRGRSIRDNANFHKDQKFILCLDIKDFFPSIKKEKIIEALNPLLNDDYLVYFISEFSTFNSILPQGGVTSPALSNIVFKVQDEIIKKLCNGMNINYSRYADDLYFSSNYFKDLIELKPKIADILKKAEFDLNEDKTRFMKGGNKKMVTGLYLNSGEITVGQERKRLVRSALFNYLVKGDASVNLNETFGMISFISMIENNYKQHINEYIAKLKLKKIIS